MDIDECSRIHIDLQSETQLAIISTDPLDKLKASEITFQFNSDLLLKERKIYSLLELDWEEEEEQEQEERIKKN